jgi:DUF4097 and DUF4098 domain-containing protein YvlB
MKRLLLIFSASAVLLSAGTVRMTVDPSRQITVRADVLNGSLTVSGYEGNEVEATSSAQISGDLNDNSVRIHGPLNGSLHVRVPSKASLRLGCGSNCSLRIDHVSGELELNNMNGGITVSNAVGAVVASSVNGTIEVTFDRIATDRPTSLSSVNGSISVFLPADVKTTVQMKTQNGRIESEFEMRLAAGTYGRGQITTASINNGGPTLTLRTVNGNIHIRKR